MQFTKKQKVAAVLGAGAMAVAGGGVAFAYWTTSGSGDGSAATGTSQNVSVSQVGSVTGLVPGATASTVNFKVTNPATYNQYVASVAMSIVNVDGTAWSSQSDATKPACTASDFTLTQPAAINSDLTPGDHAYTAAIALNDAGTNQDNCQNVTVPLHFAAS